VEPGPNAKRTRKKKIPIFAEKAQLTLRGDSADSSPRGGLPNKKRTGVRASDEQV